MNKNKFVNINMKTQHLNQQLLVLPIIANFSTNDIQIYWSKDLRSDQSSIIDWKYCSSIILNQKPNQFIVTAVQQPSIILEFNT